MAQYEVTLRDYWRILRRRKGVVIFTAFLLGFFSFVLAQIWQPIPEYTAEAKIQIEANQSMASLYLESFGYSVGDEIETKISVIRSYPVLRRIAVAMGMMENAATLADTTTIVQGLEVSIDVEQAGYATKFWSFRRLPPIPSWRAIWPTASPKSTSNTTLSRRSNRPGIPGNSSRRKFSPPAIAWPRPKRTPSATARNTYHLYGVAGQRGAGPDERRRAQPAAAPECGIYHRDLAGLAVLVHLRRDFLACDKALRAQISQPAVRSFGVVMLSPILNDDAGFA